jgi:transposase
LGFTVGFGQRPRERTVFAGDLSGVKREIEQARRRFGLSKEARVLSCYEAGRDGFWLHRYLIHGGVGNLVVDSSSIEVNRRARRAKTDKMDLGKLLGMLMRYDHGERKVWSVVRVPTVEQEDSRQLHRDLEALRGERTRHINRIKGLLASYGVRMRVAGDFLHRLEIKRLWDGRPVPLGLKERLVREYERFDMVNRQIADDSSVAQSSWDWSQQCVALCNGVFWVAGVSERSRGWCIGRPHSNTPSEWR